MISRRILAAFALLCALALPAHAQTGSQKSLAQMNTEIGTNLPTTGTNTITAFILRQTMLDFVASVPFLSGTNTFSGSNTFSGAVTFLASPSANNYKVNGDIVLTHPLTPNPDNTATSNITLGVGAGAAVVPIHSTQYLTLIGYSAGASITTADHITAVGAFALASFTSQANTANTAVGIDTLRALTSGADNTAIGEHAAASATTLGASTSIGAQSMFFVAGGANNTAIGQSALLSNVVTPLTGNENTAVGSQSIQNARDGAAGNTAVGFQALFSMAASNFNTAVGYRALSALTTGNFNVAIGWAGLTAPLTGNDNILLGTVNHPADTVASGTSNQLNIGGLIYGNLASGGIGIGTSADPGAGLIYTNSASFILRSKTTLSSGAAAQTATLTNGPSAGNPTKWLPYDDNGTTRYIPAW